MILYCEIDNFTAKRVDNGLRLIYRVADIYDSEPESTQSTLPADSRSANTRDYFIAYQMLIPKELPAGTYKLRLTMEDRNGKVLAMPTYRLKSQSRSLEIQSTYPSPDSRTGYPENWLQIQRINCMLPSSVFFGSKRAGLAVGHL